MGETWGISGPAFLVAYVVLGLAVWVATTRARRALAEGPDRPGPSADHPHDLALLNGGAELAITSALTSMHLKGTVAPSRGEIVAVGSLDRRADGLERAVHAAAASPVHRRRLPVTRPVRTELEAAEKRLVAHGLLLPGPRRAAIRSVGRWTAAVAGLGLVRLLAGLSEGRPVGFLVVLVLGFAAVALVQLLRAPRRSRPADRLLHRLRIEHHSLRPAFRPDWVAYGPAAAVTGIGVFGASALWASDPALAQELAMQRTAGGGGGDGGGAVVGGGDGGSSGGDGGGGGGGCGGGCGG
jgi:uncharacterized protein (TIGR04222 family)